MDIQVTTTLPENWNRILANSPDGNIFQYTASLEFMVNDCGFTPFFIQAIENGKVRAQLLGFRCCKYDHLKGKIPSLMYRIVDYLFPAFFWTYGPIGNDETAYQEVLKEVKNLCRKKRWLLYRSQVFPLNDKEQAFTAEGFVKYPRGTFIIDLSQSENELWKGIHHSARTHIRRAQEQGVTVKTVETLDDFDQYISILTENKKRSGNFNSFEITSTLWRAYKERGIGEIFLAMKDGKVLAGIGVMHFNGLANEYGIALAQKAIQQKIAGNDILKWHAIRWAKENGCKQYDLTGVYQHSKDKKEQGIFAFKKKWGGRLVAYNEYYLPGQK